MSDLIDRQQAIEAICMKTCGVSLKTERCMIHCTEVQTVEKLPPAQPEHIKGHWIYHPEWANDGECGYERDKQMIYKREIGAYNGGYAQGYKDAKAEQPEPHWIPVTERLPEIRHDVLFAVFFHETWRTMQGYRQDGEFMFWYNGRLESALDDEHRVSAWMPLPEPYKEVTT